MKKLLMAALAFLALVSCAGKRPAARQTLTLLTYNVGAFSKYEESGIAGVADLIRASGATLVGLNELDSCNRRHANYQVKDLAQELGGWFYYFASAFPYAGGAYGNGVVSQKAIRYHYRVILPQGEGAEQRSLSVVETDQCVLGAVHLDHRSQAAALEQMKVVNSWFAAHYAGCAKPVFLCGDFNVVPDSPVIALAQTEWTLLSGTEFTHSTANPRHCIDYIFAYQKAAPVQVMDYMVYTDGASRLSDHFPVRVVVSF
jgi:endonuclease/exonuclease/phosphatase family metal-dependent hydrolase